MKGIDSAGKVVLSQPLNKTWQPAVVCPQALAEPVRSVRECVCEGVCWDITHQVDPVHDADAEGHEGLGEVNDLFSLCCDSEACNC